jgi:hypothetical protein
MDLLSATMRGVAAIVIAVALAACSASAPPPLTPEEKTRQAGDKLRPELRPERCNEALNGAREYKEAGSGMGDLPMSRCPGARP